MPISHWPLPRSDIGPVPPVPIRVDAPAGFTPYRFGRVCKCSYRSEDGGDHTQCFHQIIDNILGHCSNTALANFRGTSKGFNRLISEHLLEHINLKSMYVGGGNGQKFYLFSLKAPRWLLGQRHALARIKKLGNQDAPSVLNESDTLDLTLVFPYLSTVRRINSIQSFHHENDRAITLVDFFSRPFILNASEYGDITEHIIHLSDQAIHGMEVIDYARLPGTLKRITIVIADVPEHDPTSPSSCEHCQTFVKSVEDIVIGALEALVRGASVTIVGLELLQCPEDDDDTLTVEAINIRRIKQSVAGMFRRYPGVKTGYVMKQICFKKSVDWWASSEAKVMYPLPDYLNYT